MRIEEIVIVFCNFQYSALLCQIYLTELNNISTRVIITCINMITVC